MIFTRQPSSTNLRYSLGSSEWCFLGLALLMRPTVKVTEGESEGSLLGAGTNRSRSMREGWTYPGWVPAFGNSKRSGTIDLTGYLSVNAGSGSRSLHKDCSLHKNTSRWFFSSSKRCKARWGPPPRWLNRGQTRWIWSAVSTARLPLRLSHSRSRPTRSHMCCFRRLRNMGFSHRRRMRRTSRLDLRHVRPSRRCSGRIKKSTALRMGGCTGLGIDFLKRLVSMSFLCLYNTIDSDGLGFRPLWPTFVT